MFTLTPYRLTVALGLALLSGLTAGPGLAAERFVLDVTHTFPSFEIRHQGVSTMRGKFNKSQGHVMLEPGGTGNLIDVTVDPASVDTGLEDLNQKLRGAAFFNVSAYPEVRFVATDIEFIDGKPVSARGQLTLLGQTRPLRLEIRDYACTLQFLTRRPLCGADVHATLRRSDFGMKFGIPLVGDEVKLAIEVEGFRE